MILTLALKSGVAVRIGNETVVRTWSWFARRLARRFAFFFADLDRGASTAEGVLPASEASPAAATAATGGGGLAVFAGPTASDGVAVLAGGAP